MVSKTSICNKTLRKLGAKPVINVDTDTSRQATLCKSAYDDVLDEVLREHNWNFAVTRQALNKDASGSPLYEFSNRFILPTLPKFIKLISIENNPDYRLESGFILANAEELNIRYVARITDTNRYDSMFIEVLSARLAAEIAFALTSDATGKTLTQKMQQEYLLALSRARDIDFQEDNQKAITNSQWNDSRFVAFDRSVNDFSPIPENA